MQKKLLVIFFYTSIIFFSCSKKESKPVSLNPFYHMKVNNDLKKIAACGTSDYVAEYIRDTVIFAGFGCGGERAGFYIKGQTTDGTHILDNRNSAWYDLGPASYTTDSLNKGILTIKSSIFEYPNGGRIPIVEGKFSFDAIDKKTGKRIKVTSGTYLLRKQHF